MTQDRGRDLSPLQRFIGKMSHRGVQCEENAQSKVISHLLHLHSVGFHNATQNLCRGEREDTLCAPRPLSEKSGNVRIVKLFVNDFFGVKVEFGLSPHRLSTHRNRQRVFFLLIRTLSRERFFQKEKFFGSKVHKIVDFGLHSLRVSTKQLLQYSLSSCISNSQLR